MGASYFSSWCLTSIVAYLVSNYTDSVGVDSGSFGSEVDASAVVLYAAARHALKEKALRRPGPVSGTAHPLC